MRFRRFGYSRKARRAPAGQGPHDRSGPEIHKKDRASSCASNEPEIFPPKKSAWALRIRTVRPASSASPSNCSSCIGGMSITPARRRPRAASRVTTASASGAAATAEFEPVNRARKPGLARGPSQRSRSAASKMVRGQIECPLLVRIFPGDRAVPDRAECLRRG